MGDADRIVYSRTQRSDTARASDLQTEWTHALAAITSETQRFPPAVTQQLLDLDPALVFDVRPATGNFLPELIAVAIFFQPALNDALKQVIGDIWDEFLLPRLRQRWRLIDPNTGELP